MTLCLFFGTVILNFERLRQGQSAVLRAGTESLWSANQLAAELQRLLFEFGAGDDPRNALDLDQLRFRVDILWSRLPPLLVGRDSAILRESRELASLGRELEGTLERLSKRIDAGVTDRAAYRAEREQLAAMVGPIRELAINALHRTGHAHADLQQRLDDIYRSNIAASVGLAASVLALLSLYAFQQMRSRQLIEAHERDNAQIQYLANHDVLTGLPNRRLFHQRLSQAIAEGQRKSSIVSLHFIDLDQFKSINDALGHIAGDQVLREAAFRLSATLHEGDLLARIAGDEFAIIQSAIDSAAAASALDQRLLAQFVAPFHVDGKSILVGISIGTTLFPDDGRVCQQLLANADVALHQAKASGRRQSILFDDTLLAAERDRRSLAGRMQSAACYDELSLRYQPKFAAGSNAVTGFEVLLRWDRGAAPKVGPAEFVPIAERCGAIVPIGEWVIRSACRELLEHRLGGYPIAINLSPIQLKDEPCARRIIANLRLAGFPIHDVEFEITETSLLSNDPVVLANIEQLHAAGAQICLDDFGTGYSSLSHLQALPLNAMKLDRSFVARLDDDKTHCICQGIVALGHRLGLRIVGEGAESLQQYQELVEIGCDQVQGFFLARPMTIDDLRGFLDQHDGAHQRAKAYA